MNARRDARRPRSRARATVLLAVTLAASTLALAGCSDGGGASTPKAPADADGADIRGTVRVLAASSLTGAFTEIGKRFEAANPGVKVTFSFGSSATLATQIANGAPADVFAAASPDTMQRVVDAGQARTPSMFASNTLEIAVPPGNPAKITGLADLARKNVRVAVCEPSAPCGAATAAVLRRAKVDVAPVTREVDVKATLTKVQLGEVDAGLVYATDVKAAAGKVDGVPIPDDVNATTTYPITVLAGTRNRPTALAFVAAVTSLDGPGILREAGFGAP